MIHVEGLRKEFRIYHRRTGILREIIGAAKENRDYAIVRPLDNVNLSVPSGKVHGIIGMNGAGKSTLLKILTGVLSPTTGRIEMNGRVAALLELGTGFHGELTGRENVYLNGSIHGFTHAEIDRKIGEIMSFAELDDFFDRPVKIYSSGMYVRLAFAFAVSVEPDVLIIDEALSVGDAYFQQKCLKKILEFKERGTTILFVSHDLGAVKMLCDEVTLLSRGHVLFSGTPYQALDLYNALLAEHKDKELVEARVAAAESALPNESYVSGGMQVEITSARILDENEQEVLAILSGQKVCIQVNARVNAEQVENPTCGILIKDRLGYDIFGTNTHSLGTRTGTLVKGDSISIDFSLSLNLGPGDYTLTVALHSDRTHINDSYHWIDRALIFKVLPSTDFEFIGVSRLEPSVGFRRL